MCGTARYSGFLLFCIYACSRFGEAAKGSNADLEFQTAKETLLIELSLRNYKTARGDRKGVLLPLIALGNGLHRWSWGMAWRQARMDSGAAVGNLVMPADDQKSKGWRSRRMTTAEGSFWVKRPFENTNSTCPKCGIELHITTRKFIRWV